jgi:hypothetical protein
MASEFFHRSTLEFLRGRRECRGNAGCWPHPWSACNKKARGRTTGSAGAAGIPCAMVYGLYVVSPVRPGFVVTVALRHLARRSTCIGAPGPHDLMSSGFFGLLKRAEALENKGFFRFPLEEQKAAETRRDLLGPSFTSRGFAAGRRARRAGTARLSTGRTAAGASSPERTRGGQAHTICSDATACNRRSP